MWQELMVKEEAEESSGFPLLSTRSLVLFQALVTSGCFLVLGGLALWHAKLISRGETSIEAHINRCQAKSSRVMATLAGIDSSGACVSVLQLQQNAYTFRRLFLGRPK